jgi:hypothetical protein
MTLVGLIKHVAGVEEGMMALTVTDRSAALTLGNGKPQPPRMLVDLHDE